MKEGPKIRWRRLDNTAKIFPVIANESMSQVFRVSATMKEPVQPELLQKALEAALQEFPGFGVKLRRGIFWYYFEENKKTPLVEREYTYPCRYINPHGNHRFLFRVTYFGRRINLEVFHALTDGLGSIRFLKALTAHYLELCADGALRESTERGEREHRPAEDSYLKNYHGARKRRYSSVRAYHIDGSYLPFGSCQVLHGCASASEARNVCHQYGVSMTKYLAAALLWAIWKEYLDGRVCKNPVVLNLPINLRAFFPSDTISNFFAVTMIGWLFQNPEMEFEQLLGIVSRQMDRKIEKSRLEECIAYNVSNEKKWYLRVIPLVIKRPVLALVFRLKERAYTMTLSNLGLITMEEHGDQIEHMQFMIGVSRRQPIKCGVCAFGDRLMITFTSVFADSRLQRRFFSRLKADGITVRVEGNELSAAGSIRSYPRVRKILIRRKGGEEKAARMAKKLGNTGGWAAKGLWAYLTGRKSWREELNRRFHV